MNFSTLPMGIYPRRIQSSSVKTFSSFHSPQTKLGPSEEMVEMGLILCSQFITNTIKIVANILQ